MSTITDELREAVFFIWNTQIEEADAILATKKDTDARYALHYAENLWLFSFTSDLKSVQEETSIRLSQARKLADAERKKAFKAKGKGTELLNSHTEATIVYGEALLLTSFNQLINHDYAKAILNLKDSYNIFKDFEKNIDGVEDKIDPELYNLLKFDLGMFMFFLSLLSEVLGPGTRKLLSVIGLKGDQEKGLQYLNDVIASNSIRSGFAYSILLAKFLLLGEAQFVPGRQSDLEKGVELTLVANSKFPLSLSFNLFQGAVLRIQGNFAEAAAHFEESANRLISKNYDPSAARVNVAHCYFDLCDWDRAIEIYQEVEASNSYIYTYTATLYKGLALVMKGREEEGHEAILSASKAGKDDSEFKFLADRYISNGFFGFFEVLFIRGEFKFTPERAEELSNVLAEIANKLGINAESRGDTPTTRKYKHTKKQKESHVIILNAVKGKLLRLQNRNDEALVHFNRIIPLKPSGKVEKNIYWECLCEAVKILLEQNKKAEALPLLQKIADAGNTASKGGAIKALSVFNN